MPVKRLVAETPESVGVSSAALERLYAAASEEVTSGRLAGCAVAVARNGRLAGTAAFGTTSNGAATESTLFHIFSSTKAIMGVAMAQLLEEGRLTLETKVSDIIPGWGANGKEGVTIRHLVTFSAVTPRSFHPTPTALRLRSAVALRLLARAAGFPEPAPRGGQLPARVGGADGHLRGADGAVRDVGAGAGVGRRAGLLLDV